MAVNPRDLIAAALPQHDPDAVMAVMRRRLAPAIEDLDVTTLWRQAREAAATIDSWATNGFPDLASRLADLDNIARRIAGGAF